MRRGELHWERAGEPDLFLRSWVPPRPVRTLLVVHGYAEHCGRYEALGAWFAARGCAVFSCDQRGHGRSQGIRCHVGHFGEYLDDLQAVLERSRSEQPGLPVFLVGHSMGGLVTAAFVRERKPDLAGLVTSGALLAPPESGRARLLAVRALARLAPRLSFASPVDPAALSRDPSVGAAYLADPLVESRMTASLGAALFAAIGRTGPGGADVSIPYLALHGEADPLCPVEGSRRFSADAPQGRFRGYPELRHEIFNEPEAESIFGDVLEWIREIEGGARIAEPA